MSARIAFSASRSATVTGDSWTGRFSSCLLSTSMGFRQYGRITLRAASARESANDTSSTAMAELGARVGIFSSLQLVQV